MPAPDDVIGTPGVQTVVSTANDVGKPGLLHGNLFDFYSDLIDTHQPSAIF